MSALHRARVLARRIGVDVRRYPSESVDYGLFRALQATHPDLVLDVGANRGQFAQELRNWGYTGRIISVEPVPAVFTELAAAAAPDANWTAVHAAVSSSAGVVTIHVAGNGGASSSVLPMLESHRVAAPEANYVGSVDVDAVTLDSLISDRARPNDSIFLKLDVQGFESEVLAGLDQGWSRICGVRSELSLIPLYEGGVAWRDMVDLLSKRGFEMVEVAPGFRDPTTHQQLQFDAIFHRRNAETGDASQRGVA